MKLLLRVAMTAVSIASIPPAIAGEGSPDLRNFIAAPPAMFAYAPEQIVPSVDVASRGQL